MSRGKKAKTDAPTANTPPQRTIRRLTIVALTLAVSAGLIWGISRLGEEARRGLGTRDRYSVRFAEIECEPPPELDRSTFLSEVRYNSKFPERFQSLDPDLTTKLTAAFITHPWVAGLESVIVEATGTVRVKLKYRTPILAVRTTTGTRVVDGERVLLPVATKADGLPELITQVATPNISAGQVWVDETVKRAVELVDTHHPKKLEKTQNGWRLTLADGKTLALER